MQVHLKATNKSDTEKSFWFSLGMAALGMAVYHGCQPAYSGLDEDRHGTRRKHAGKKDPVGPGSNN